MADTKDLKTNCCAGKTGKYCNECGKLIPILAPKKIDLNTSVTIPFIWDATDLEKKTCLVTPLPKDAAGLDVDFVYRNYLLPAATAKQKEQLGDTSTNIEHRRLMRNTVLKGAKIAHSVGNGSSETLHDIICSLIENRISNPVCGASTLYGFGLSSLTVDKPVADQKVNMTFYRITDANKETVLRNMLAAVQEDHPSVTCIFTSDIFKGIKQQQQQLDDALRHFTTICYSAKHRRIMTLNDMTEILSYYPMFDVDLKSLCQHFKLKHIDVWIMHENLDALLDFEKLRATAKKMFKLPLRAGYTDGHYLSLLSVFK